MAYVQLRYDPYCDLLCDYVEVAVSAVFTWFSLCLSFCLSVGRTTQKVVN